MTTTINEAIGVKLGCYALAYAMLSEREVSVNEALDFFDLRDESYAEQAEGQVMSAMM